MASLIYLNEHSLAIDPDIKYAESLLAHVGSRSTAGTATAFAPLLALIFLFLASIWPIEEAIEKFQPKINEIVVAQKKLVEAKGKLACVQVSLQRQQVSPPCKELMTSKDDPEKGNLKTDSDLLNGWKAGKAEAYILEGNKSKSAKIAIYINEVLSDLEKAVLPFELSGLPKFQLKARFGLLVWMGLTCFFFWLLYAYRADIWWSVALAAQISKKCHAPSENAQNTFADASTAFHVPWWAMPLPHAVDSGKFGDPLEREELAHFCRLPPASFGATLVITFGVVICALQCFVLAIYWRIFTIYSLSITVLAETESGQSLNLFLAGISFCLVIAFAFTVVTLYVACKWIFEDQLRHLNALILRPAFKDRRRKFMSIFAAAAIPAVVSIAMIPALVFPSLTPPNKEAKQSPGRKRAKRHLVAVDLKPGLYLNPFSLNFHYVIGSQESDPTSYLAGAYTRTEGYKVATGGWIEILPNALPLTLDAPFRDFDTLELFAAESGRKSDVRNSILALGRSAEDLWATKKGADTIRILVFLMLYQLQQMKLGKTTFVSEYGFRLAKLIYALDKSGSSSKPEWKDVWPAAGAAITTARSFVRFESPKDHSLTPFLGTIYNSTSRWSLSLKYVRI